MVIPLSTRNPYIPYLNPTVGLMTIPYMETMGVDRPQHINRTHPNFGTSKFAFHHGSNVPYSYFSDHEIQPWAPIQPVGYVDANIPNVTPTCLTSAPCRVCCLLGLYHIYTFTKGGGPSDCRSLSNAFLLNTFPETSLSMKTVDLPASYVSVL